MNKDHTLSQANMDGADAEQSYRLVEAATLLVEALLALTNTTEEADASNDNPDSVESNSD